jgi:hypothetical protein
MKIIEAKNKTQPNVQHYNPRTKMRVTPQPASTLAFRKNCPIYLSI